MSVDFLITGKEDFNSQPHKGADKSGDTKLTVTPDISIHSPTRGLTAQGLITRSEQETFQFTAPQGG